LIFSNYKHGKYCPEAAPLLWYKKCHEKPINDAYSLCLANLARLIRIISIYLLHSKNRGNDWDDTVLPGFPWLLLVAYMVRQQSSTLPRYIISGPVHLLTV
jgi:hypothetical protein